MGRRHSLEKSNFYGPPYGSAAFFLKKCSVILEYVSPVNVIFLGHFNLRARKHLSCFNVFADVLKGLYQFLFLAINPSGIKLATTFEKQFADDEMKCTRAGKVSQWKRLFFSARLAIADTETDSEADTTFNSIDRKKWSTCPRSKKCSTWMQVSFRSMGFGDRRKVGANETIVPKPTNWY